MHCAEAGFAAPRGLDRPGEDEISQCAHQRPFAAHSLSDVAMVQIVKETHLCNKKYDDQMTFRSSQLDSSQPLPTTPPKINTYEINQHSVVSMCGSKMAITA